MTKAPHTPQRVWFITGASRGLGRAFTRAALARGDSVYAVSRNGEHLDELAASSAGAASTLQTRSVDVTQRAEVFEAIADAVESFGRLDVIVNNAGVLTLGMVEEFTESEAAAIMDVNFFGALWVSQAAMRQMRLQGHGHLVQVSSIAALGGYPMTGLYSASKFALEGLSESLAHEAGSFGAKVSILQPGGYWTDLYARMGQTAPIAGYDALRTQMEQEWSGETVDSDPKLAAEALLKIIDADDPPLRLLLGSMVFDLAFDATHERMVTWSEWEQVSRDAEHAVPSPIEAETVRM